MKPRWPFARRRPTPAPEEAWRSAASLVPVVAQGSPLVAAEYFRAPDVAGTRIVVPVTPVPPELALQALPAHPESEALTKPRRTTPPKRSRQVEEWPQASEAGEWPHASDVEEQEPDGRREIAPEAEPAAEPEAEPEVEAAGADLSGIIAMLDSEVRRGAVRRGESPSEPVEPERPTLMRPTLATSRRRGVGVPHPAPSQTTPPESPPSTAAPAAAATAPESPQVGVPEAKPVATVEVVQLPAFHPERPEPVTPPVGPERALEPPTALPAAVVAATAEPVERVVSAPTASPEPAEPGARSEPGLPEAAVVAPAQEVPTVEDEPRDASAIGLSVRTPDDMPPAEPVVLDAPRPATPVPDLPPDDGRVPPERPAPDLPLPLASVRDYDVGQVPDVAESPAPQPMEAQLPEPVPVRPVPFEEEPAREPDAAAAAEEGVAPAADRTVPQQEEPPEVTAPEVTAPEVTAPEVTAPEVTAPEVTAPEVTAPEMTAPEVTQSETTARETVRTQRRQPEPVAWAPAPAQTVATFGRMTGVDLGFVPVVRARETSAQAAELSARAFTHRGVVHLPEEAGPVDRDDAQAVLAHELTHVMQQRALGPQASESGPLGDQLEAQAQAVERSVRGEAVAPEEWDWPDELDEDVPAGLTWTPGDGFQHMVQAPAPYSVEARHGGGPPQRAPFAGASWAPTPLQPSSPGEPAVDRAETDVQPLVYPEGPEVEASHQATEELPAPPAVEHVLSDDELARVAGLVTAALDEPYVDVDDPDLLDALAGGLYERLRVALRRELITDRERAGLLTEFH